MDNVYTILKSSGETVEKVPRQILGGDAEKNDLTECATIDDLAITKGRETPENRALTILKGFSTVSEGTFALIQKASPFPYCLSDETSILKIPEKWPFFHPLLAFISSFSSDFSHR